MGLIQNVFNWLAGPYKVNRWGIDISFWNTLTDTQLREMVSNGLSFMWIAMINGITEDKLFRAHVDQARRFKIPFGVYAWLVPNMNPEQQGAAGIGLYEKYAADACNWMADYEQEKEGQLGTGNYIPTATIADTMNRYTTYITQRFTKPYAFYSGPNYINTFWHDGVAYTKKYYYVNASYASNTVITLDWAGFKRYTSNIGRPTLPAGVSVSDVDAHQFTSAIQIKLSDGSIMERLDFDAIQDENVYKTLFASAVIVPPIIIPPGTPDIRTVVSTSALPLYALRRRVRPDMNAATLGYLKPGDKVFVKAISGGWANIHTDGSGVRFPYLFVSTPGDGWVGSSYLK